MTTKKKKRNVTAKRKAKRAKKRDTPPRSAPLDIRATPAFAAGVAAGRAEAEEALLSIDEAAARFGVPARALREAIKAGDVRAIPFSGAIGWKMRGDAVRAWLATKEGGQDPHRRGGSPSGPSAEMAARGIVVTGDYDESTPTGDVRGNDGPSTEPTLADAIGAAEGA